MAKKATATFNTNEAPPPPPPRKRRSESAYLLLKETTADEPDAMQSFVAVTDEAFPNPGEAWAYAREKALTGRLHVVCHRGTKTGKTQEVFDLE